MSEEINGKVANEIVIDPGSTHSLIDWACARRLGLHISKGANFQIELENGELEKPKGVTKSCHLVLAQTTVDVKFCVVDARGSYEVILGLNWLKTVKAKGLFGEGLYQVGKVFLRQIDKQLVEVPQDEEDLGNAALIGDVEASEGSDIVGTESSTSEDANLDDLMAQLGMEDVLEEEEEPLVVARSASIREELQKLDVNPELNKEVHDKVWETLYEFEDCFAASFTDLETTPFGSFTLN